MLRNWRFCYYCYNCFCVSLSGTSSPISAFVCLGLQVSTSISGFHKILVPNKGFLSLHKNPSYMLVKYNSILYGFKEETFIWMDAYTHLWKWRKLFWVAEKLWREFIYLKIIFKHYLDFYWWIRISTCVHACWA